MHYRATVLYALAFVTVPAVAMDSATESFVQSITSTAQVKQKLKELMMEPCGGGSGCDSIAAEICSYVAALDAKVDSLILGTWTDMNGPKPQIQISRRDIELMKLVYSQCKPTNYQYWLWDSVLHVSYLPSDRVDKVVRKALGAERK